MPSIITGAGAAFGWMRHATGSTRAATIMHSSYNALFFFALFAAQKERIPGVLRRISPLGPPASTLEIHPWSKPFSGPTTASS